MSTMTFDADRVERADKIVALLAAPGTTRILNELLDFGPLPRHQQGSPFPEFNSSHVTYYFTSLRQRGLVEVQLVDDVPALVASEAAVDLGDVYDALNVWAKTHLPHTAELPYVTRVHETLTLLGEPFTVPILAALANGPVWSEIIELLIRPCVHSVTARAAVAEHLPRLATRGLIDHADQDLDTVTLTGAGRALLTPLAGIDSWGATHAHIPVGEQRRAVIPAMAHAVLPSPARQWRTR
ncbi:hypothetical protein ACFY0R_09970 [Streptomyces sp. NPDC001633]|uniref:hypothetical protein n=1 Tax=Streptomyces sp. NPDC001633 TaxID=3364595 RepID=UPI00367C56C7